MKTTIDFSWQDNASCKSMSVENFDKFYPKQGRVIEKSNSLLCLECPVQDECLNHALKYEDYGYWGGTTAIQRRALRKKLGIKLVDIEYENTIKYAHEKERIEEAIQANKMKRGPKGPRKVVEVIEEEEEELCELDLLFRY